MANLRLLGKKMKIKYYSNPFNENFKEIEVAEYSTCEDVIKSSGLPLAKYIIYINDKIFNYPECKDIIIPENAIISVMLEIENGKAFEEFIKNPVTQITALVGAALLFIPGAQGIGLSILIGIGVGALGALFTKDVDPDDSVGKNKYSISGTQNESQLDNIFPMVLGKARVYPPYTANYYVALDDKSSGDGDQYLYALLNLGYKDLKVSNIKMGDTLIATNTSDVRNGLISIDGGLAGITAEIRQDGTIPATYGTPHKMTQLNAQIKQEDLQAFVYTTPKNTQKITIGLQFNGLFKQNSDGGLDEATVQMAYYYRKAGTTTWIPAGEDTSSENVYNIPYQERVYYYNDGIRTRTYFYKINKQTVIGPTFKVLTNDGYKNGRLVGGTIEVYLQTSPNASEWKSITYTNDTITSSGASTIYTAKTRDVLRFEVDILPTASDVANNPSLQWDIMVQRLSADDRTNYNDNIIWSYAIYELGGIIMQQQQLDKCCLLALRIQANEITQANINKINAICQLVAPVYDSETDTWSDSAPVPTSNPAALMRKVLKGNYMNKPAIDSLIDYVALNKLYTFCETNNYMCNGVISEQETLSDILQKILGTCRTEFYIKNSMYSCVIDDVQPTPVAILSPKNTSDFTWTRTFGEKIACYSIKYQNADQDYKDIVEDVYPIGEMEADGDLKQDCNIWGVDNHEQIFKIGRYLHAVNKLRRELYTITMPVEHFALSKGQRALLSHDVISIGTAVGNIKDYDSVENTITVDEVLSATDPLKSYGVQITTDTGVIVVPCKVEITSSIITLLEVPNITITAGMTYAFGETGKESLDCIIKNIAIEQSPQLNAKIELVAYAPAIFDADTTPVPDFDANITDTTFDISMIATGEAATVGKIIGSSIKDDGIIFFDFEEPSRYFDDWRPVPTNTDRLYNYGSSKENGDAVITGTLAYEIDSDLGYTFVKCNGGYFTTNADNALYGDFSLSLWLKGTVPVSKEVIMQILDDDNYLHFTIYFENEKMMVNLQDIDREITGIDYNKFTNASLICFDYNESESLIKIYQDGVLVSNIDWGEVYDDEGVFNSDAVTYDDEGVFDSDSVTYDDEGIYEASLLGKSHTKSITFLCDEAGTYPCTTMSIARLRIFTDHIDSTGVWNLYFQDALYININAQSRYMGELKAAPAAGFMYEYFKYVGDETEDYLYNRYYQRTANGWRLLKPSAEG